MGWLLEEPFKLKAEEIARLTDRQIVGLYGRERDSKTGKPKPVGVKSDRHYVTPEEGKAQFVGIMTAFGKSVDEAEALWAKKLGG